MVLKLANVLLEERTLAAVVLAGGIFLGLGVPTLADRFEPLALPALFVVVVFSLIPFARLPLAELVGLDRDSLRTVAWQLIVLPCIVIAAGVLAHLSDAYIQLMIVTACAGSLFSSPAIAELLDLDRQRALRCMVLSTLLMPVSLFVFLSVFKGVNVELELGSYAVRTLVFLGIPFVLVGLYRMLARRLTPGVSGHVAVAARWGTVASLLVFGIGLMSQVSNTLESNPVKVLSYLVVATALCLVMMALTTVVMYRHGLTEALTAGIVSGFRNIGLGFALVGQMIGPDLAVYAGISLLPVFVAPMILRFMTAKKPDLNPAFV
jgi:BASS family bile acid:Na+ symporter